MTTVSEALLAHLPDGVVVMGVDGRVRWANRAAEEQLGWRLDELLGRSGLDLVHPDDLATAATALLSVQDKTLGTSIELRLLGASGAFQRFEVRGRPGLDVEGMAGVVLVLRDVTDRRRWEVAAGDGRLLQAIIDSAPAITLLLTADGLIRGASRAMTRLLGRDLEYTIGRSFAEMAVVEDAHRVASEIALSVSERERVFEARFVTVSGDTAVPMSVSVVNLLDDLSVGGLVVTATDITPLADARAELQHLATHDVLTGLPNRALLRDRLDHALAGAERRSTSVSVVYVDVDGFKDINDRYGHACGDAVLVEIAQRLRSTTRSSDTVSRVGGDEFVIVLEDDGGTAAQRLLGRLVDTMVVPIDVGARRLQVHLSAGVATQGTAGGGTDDLLARADADMYRVKATSRVVPVVTDRQLSALHG